MKKGQTIICVNAKGQNWITEGKEYIIREVVTHPNEPLAVRLEGINLGNGTNGYGERAFNASRFALANASGEPMPAASKSISQQP